MTDPLIADRRFFAALVAADVPTLEQLIADDFVIVDVFSGSEAARPDLLGGLASGVLRFTQVEPEAARVRRYGTTAVITGSTRMGGTFNGSPFQVHSRYTHVYSAGPDETWRLVSAQGTPIAGG